ncbi:hypothetical protein [Psychrobacter sp. I-STPA6b]|uniref:hypothetical protein n=1 Tax=Psychrobacter sp. I-STPA6b TaxID=2585718 RepID=UPI001D0CA260|nr:hypothetical protein [Psychrobacter sp. I-STPA6b]
MKKDIEYFRQKIRTMDYTPLTDEELAEVLEIRESAVASSRLEGVYTTEEEKEFFAMLAEERLPIELRQKIAKEWVFSNL